MIEAIAWIVGPIERVAAYFDHRVHTYTAEDTATLLLRFASGAYGVVQSHFNCYQNALEIQAAPGGSGAARGGGAISLATCTCSAAGR